MSASLGFKVDWEHRFAADAPLYMQVSRGKTKLHLSEHHGDAVPGATVLVYTTGLDALHKEINAKNYRFNRLGIEDFDEGGDRCMTAIDPFHNRIHLWEKAKRAHPSTSSG